MTESQQAVIRDLFSKLSPDEQAAFLAQAREFFLAVQQTKTGQA